SGGFSNQYPMLLQFETNGGTAKLKSCFGIGGNSATGADLCAKMGGAWLKNPEESYFPNERCHFGGLISLNMSEWPDVLSADGVVKDQMRPLECRYTASNGLSTILRCEGRSPQSRKVGWVCRYDRKAKSWKKSRITKVTGNYPNFTYQYDSRYENRYPCTLGVTASSNSDVTSTLEFDQPLAQAFKDEGNQFTTNGNVGLSSITKPSVAEYLAESDRIQTVINCQRNANVDAWTPCINPTNPALARAGGKGACIYVRRGVVDSVAGLGELGIGSLFGGNRLEYTGWIYVTGARGFGMDTTKGKLPSITEAVGTPCAQVEVNTNLFVPNEFTAPTNNRLSQANFQRVAQCVVELLPTRGTSSSIESRFTVLSCEKNTSLQGDPFSWTEILADENRMADAIESFGFLGGIGSDLKTVEAGAEAFAEGVRSVSSSTPISTKIIDADDLDQFDIVRVKVPNLNGDAYDDCLLKRKGQFWYGGSPPYAAARQVSFPSDSYRRTIKATNVAGSIDKQKPETLDDGSASVPDGGYASFVRQGEFFYRLSVAKALRPDLACTRPGSLDVFPFDSIDTLKAKILAALKQETVRLAEQLSTDSCAYFDNVLVPNRANALASGSDFNGAIEGVKRRLPTAIKHTSPWTSANGPMTTLTDLERPFTGWLWLRTGLPVRKFRTVDPDKREIKYTKSTKTYATTDYSAVTWSGSETATGAGVRFSEIEFYRSGDSWASLPTAVDKATGNGTYFLPSGYFSGGAVPSTRRPLFGINGEVCTRGVRLRGGGS
ncbi:MAG: hypothetical protein RJB38_343, partial [Pseudomonadota bacterium]